MEKGGIPPPNWQKSELFAEKPQNTVLFILAEKGQYPPSPHNGLRLAKKLREKR